MRTLNNFVFSLKAAENLPVAVTWVGGVTVGNRLYVVGGAVGNDLTASAKIYRAPSTANGQWSELSTELTQAAKYPTVWTVRHLSIQN